MSGELSYTTYNPPAVKRLGFSFDGSSLRITSQHFLASLTFADGIVFAPDGKLLVGGGPAGIFEVDPSSGAVQSAHPGGPGAWHVAVDPGGTRAWAAGLPGPLSEVPLDPFRDGVAHPLTGDDTNVTSVGFAAGKAFYTASDARGIGSFGTIDLTSFRTTRLMADLRGAHGMTYDAATGDLLLIGNTDVVQIDPSNPSVVAASRTFPGLQLDQGTVDGKGHLFAASSTGQLLFVDYSATHHIDDASDVVAKAFVDPNLDDFAPLTGPGAKPNHSSGLSLVAVVGAVAAAALIGAGFAALRSYRNR
ncbi:MAG: hypothetical protein JO085_00060 [Acidimicrobiia bacterium]|nr:hypothetical protein [Acidimicrobiia bacterium]